jgi:autotransporter-associated beta strand protein
MFKKTLIRNLIAVAVSLAAMGSWARVSQCAPQVGDVFVIALENHNFTQPNPTSSPEQLYGNPAAPYLNSLITPGNPNAAQVSYATNYTNSGVGVHPSEPNYIWSEAGTNYNKDTGTTVLADSDPSAAAKNIFSTTPHLTGQMNAAGVSWKNYQEDVQYSTSPIVSVSGNGGTAPSGVTVTTNPYYGTSQYGYAVKHNPMAFFTDTASQNVYPLSQLTTDLNNNTVGKYNWITPNLYDDMHSALSTNFTYDGTTYTAGSDQEAVAEGDNFLSKIIPQIEASQAFKNNGVIIIWNDETEGGDTTAYTMPEIIISPLAKGNAYASSAAMSHSSDLKTMEEIFHLGSYLNNTIPASETNVTATGYNSVATVNDLSSLFVSGAIPSSVGEISTWTSIGSGSWSDSTKWTGGVPNADGAVATINASTSAALTVTLGNPVMLGTLLLGAGTPGVGCTLSGSGSDALTFSNTSNNATAQISVADGTHYINAPVILASNLVVTSTSSTPWTLSFGTASSIKDNGAGLSLTMSASKGTLILSGSDSYSGGTFVEAGTLKITSAYALPSRANLTIGANASSRFGAAQQATTPAGDAQSAPEPGTLALLTAAIVVGFGVRRGRRWNRQN